MTTPPTPARTAPANGNGSSSNGAGSNGSNGSGADSGPVALVALGGNGSRRSAGFQIGHAALGSLLTLAAVVIAALAFGDGILSRGTAAAQQAGAKDAQASATAAAVTAHGTSILDHEKRLTVVETQLKGIAATCEGFDKKLDRLFEAKAAGK